MESLFSLEVIVNFLKLEATKPNSSPCLLPTVAFRLLDYPIIAISLMEKFDADQLKTRLELTRPFERIEMLPCFTQLIDANGRYMFNKGKSCLFRADLSMLRGHLKNTPMYLMVLDTFYEPYKLLGTLAVPLDELIEELYEEMDEVKADNIDPLPSMKMSHGVCDVRNLMGNVIGHVSFVCRLTSFGKSIIPHLAKKRSSSPPEKQTKADSRKQETVIETSLKPPPLDLNYEEMRKKREERSVNTIEPPKTTTNENAIVQTTPIDYKETRIEISDYANSNKLDKATQSPNRQRKLKVDDKETKGGVIKQVSDENFFGEYRPPPLFFNSQLDGKRASSTVDSNQLVSEIKNKQGFIDVRMAYLNEALKHQDYLENENEPELLATSDNEETITPTKKQPQIHTNKPTIDLDQMPLLKNLIDEITQLKSMIQGSQFGAERTNLKPKPVDRKSPTRTIERPSSMKKKPHLQIIKHTKDQLTRQNEQQRREKINETVNRLSQPKTPPKSRKSTGSRQSVTVDSSTSNYKPWWDEKKNTPVPKPRQKEGLKYGLTNTVKMRIEASRGNRARRSGEEVPAENNTNKMVKIENAESLAEEVRKNLDKLNITPNVNTTVNVADENEENADDDIYQIVAGASNDQLSEIVRRTMEQMLNLESTGSVTNTSVVQNNLTQPQLQPPTILNLNRSGNQSTGNLSTMLLNRVDMESTMNDTMNYQQAMNNTGNVIGNNDQLNQTPTATKMVQFGGTHVFNRDSSRSQSPDDQQHHSTSETTSSTPRYRKKKSDDSSESSTSKTSSTSTAVHRNIFLKNNKKPADELETTTSNNFSDNNNNNNNNNNKKYEDDFNSSFESSSTHLMSAQSPRKSPRSAASSTPKYTNDFFDFENYDDYKGEEDDED